MSSSALNLKIFLITVNSATYNADDFTSYEQIAAAVTPPATTTLFANIPIVPTGANLEDPANLGSNAPINSIRLWYRCVRVEAFVFEVSLQVTHR